jgi:hypothetical protein
MAGEWIDVVDDNGDDIRVLSPADEPDEMMIVCMGTRDWEKVINSLRYLSDFSSTALAATTSADLIFLADSIQDVLSSL